MKLLRLRSLIILLSVFILVVGCDDSSTGGMENPDRATFNGKVENTSSQNSSKNSSLSTVEGAVVTAAQVNTDGSLQTISDAEAETNVEGEYSLDVDVSSISDATARVVIIARNEGQSAKAFVTARVENGSNITVQPISFESSAEAEVFQNVVANGDANIIANADIEAAVESDVAADIERNTQNAANIATALASSAEAKAEFYADQGIEISEEQASQIAEAKQQAQLQLENELNAAASTEEQQAAFNTFLQAVANAELNAGVEAWAVAESNDFAARVLIQQSTDLSADAQSDIRKQAYFFAAVAIDAAVQAEAQVLEASETTIDALTSAGASLRADIRSTTNASADNIDSFFVRFNEDVQTALNNDASVNGSAFVSANTTISGSAGLKSTLESTLGATLNINTMLSAYNEFISGVQNVVDATFTDASEAEAEAYTRLLVAINIAS